MLCTINIVFYCSQYNHAHRTGWNLREEQFPVTVLTPQVGHNICANLHHRRCLFVYFSRCFVVNKPCHHHLTCVYFFCVSSPINYVPANIKRVCVCECFVGRKWERTLLSCHHHSTRCGALLSLLFVTIPMELENNCLLSYILLGFGGHYFIIVPRYLGLYYALGDVFF